MATKDWTKFVHKHGIIWEGKTDFHKGRKYQKTSLYYYKKGSFRTKPNDYVVLVHYKLSTKEDKPHSFKTKKGAMNFVKRYIAKH